MVYNTLGIISLIAGLVCYIMVLVFAFKDEWWKGLLMLVPCVGGLWWLYYAIFEYESEYKFGIVGLAIFGNTIAFGLFRMATLNAQIP